MAVARCIRPQAKENPLDFAGNIRHCRDHRLETIARVSLPRRHFLITSPIEVVSGELVSADATVPVFCPAWTSIQRRISGSLNSRIRSSIFCEADVSGELSCCATSGSGTCARVGVVPRNTNNAASHFMSAFAIFAAIRLAVHEAFALAPPPVLTIHLRRRSLMDETMPCGQRLRPAIRRGRPADNSARPANLSACSYN